jgi:hypothetical protein
MSSALTAFGTLQMWRPFNAIVLSMIAVEDTYRSAAGEY